MRLDHLLSKEHTPRTIYRVLTFVGAAVWWALVVFTSGIIDDKLIFELFVCVVLPLGSPGGCGTVGGSEG